VTTAPPDPPTTSGARRHVVTLLLVAGVVVLFAAPLALGLGTGEEPFAGSDGQALASAEENRPGYEAWFSAPFTPPSGQIESGLFAVQAALGGVVLGYALGALRHRNRSR
jgi:cobalt/nickel transport protein